MTLFDARTLARGWLSVALASSKDEDRPALNRTVCIESFSEGLRLTSTDSYMLLTAWVPNIDHDLDPAPGLDERPYAVAVAMDPHGRAKGFMAHALKLASAARDAAGVVAVKVDLGVIDEIDEPGHLSLAGFEVPYVVLELPHEAERLKLRTYEGQYPAWRPILAGFAPEPTDRITLNPELLGRLAKIDKIQPGTYLRFQWNGPTSAAYVETVNGWPDVEGILMPIAWDFDRNEPRAETTDSADPTAPLDPTSSEA
jgi:hypothetical protein